MMLAGFALGAPGATSPGWDLEKRVRISFLSSFLSFLIRKREEETLTDCTLRGRTEYSAKAPTSPTVTTAPSAAAPACGAATWCWPGASALTAPAAIPIRPGAVRGRDLQYLGSPKVLEV